MNWTNKTNTNDFSGNYGFIYEITYDDCSLYIGKKSFISKTKKNFGKKKLAEVTDKRKKTYEYVIKESNWREYEGSCKTVGERKVVCKKIIKLCKTQQDLSYQEEKHLFERNVLFEDMYLNNNIGGRYFSGKITGSKGWK